MDYLPRDATVEESCNWMLAQTGQPWSLARLLEHGLLPYFWLDYSPSWEGLFGDRREGYQSRMLFNGDLNRLEFSRECALVTMFTAPDGRPVSVNPALRVPLGELRFKREDLEREAQQSKAEPQAEKPIGAVSRATAQEQKVMAVLRELGYEPKALPRRVAGHPWVKAEAWGSIGICSLFSSERVFEKAWERLRASGEICERPGL